MKRRHIFIAVLVALMLTTTTGSALAGEDSGTETIDFFEPFGIEIDNSDGISMKVSWDIKLVDGVPVNIALLDETNYYNFTHGMMYNAYKGNEKNYTESFKKTITIKDEGIFYLAIASAQSSMDTSTVEYKVTWDEGSGFWAPWCWPAIIIALVLIFGVGILVWLRGRGRGTAVAPLTGAGPDAMAAIELSPQPEPPDTPTDDSGYTGSGEPPAPGTGTVPSEPVPSLEGTILQDSEPIPSHLPHVLEEPAPGTGVHHPTGEGIVELSPQPEPPDAPTGRPPTPGTATVPTAPEPSAPIHIPPPPAEPTVEGTARNDPASDPPHFPTLSESPEVPGPEPQEPITGTVPHYPSATVPETTPLPPTAPSVEGVSPSLPLAESTTVLEEDGPPMDPTGRITLDEAPRPEPRTDEVRAPDPDADEGPDPMKINKPPRGDGPTGEPL